MDLVFATIACFYRPTKLFSTFANKCCALLSKPYHPITQHPPILKTTGVFLPQGLVHMCNLLSILWGVIIGIVFERYAYISRFSAIIYLESNKLKDGVLEILNNNIWHQNKDKIEL